MAYYVSNQESEEVFVILRIMIYSPYVALLKQLRRKFSSNSEMFFYLISKYYLRLNELAKRKNSSIKKYQEVTNHYLNRGLKVSRRVHQVMKDLSDTTGYSISALVRFMIEWECLNQFSNEVRLDYEPLSEVDDSMRIVINGIWIRHRYFIDLELVEEEMIWGFG